MLRLTIKISFVLLLVFSSCELGTRMNEDHTLIAEAYGKKLYLEELNPYLKNAVSKADSQIVMSRYIDEWLMDLFLLEEARSRVKNKSDIQELTKKYEESLFINELEKIYIQNKLDTLILPEEIDSFFVYHKEDFLLQEPIVRLIFIKIPDSLKTENFADLWSTEDLPALRQMATRFALVSMLEPNEWQDFNALKLVLPKEMFDKVSLNRTDYYEFTSGDHHFYIKLLEIIKDKDAAPIDYVRDRIKMRIMQDRIKQLLKEEKSKLFKDRMNSKLIKIYAKINK